MAEPSAKIMKEKGEKRTASFLTLSLKPNLCSSGAAYRISELAAHFDFRREDRPIPKQVRRAARPCAGALST